MSKKQNQNPAMAQPSTDDMERRYLTDEERDDLDRLKKEATAGSVEARQELSTFLENNPFFWQQYGDLATHAEMGLVRYITNGDWFESEIIKRCATEMRQRLQRPSPSVSAPLSSC